MNNIVIPNTTKHKPGDNVRIVIFAADLSRFAVLQETDDPALKLPGGKFEEGESILAAAIREAKEELGEGIEPADLHYAGQLTTDDGNSARYIFWAIIDQEKIKPTSEIAFLKWFSPEEVPQGKNKDHILSAVDLARGAVITTEK